MSTSTTNKSLTTQQTPAPPSSRDLEIYKCAVVLKHDQCNIAFNYNLNQSRISQIVAKVRRWLAAGGAPSDPAIRDHLAQQQLSKATQKLRLMRVIERATYAMENRLPSQVTTKSRYHGMTEVWRDEIRQQSPEINMPAMRLLLRAVKTLDDLDANPDQNTPAKKASPLSEDDLLQSVFEFLCRWRTRVEAAGHLPQSADIHQFIADGLTTLIGTPLDPTGHLVGRASGRPSSSEPQLLVSPNGSDTAATQTTTNTPDHISAPPELLVAPTTDQPSPSDN